MVKYQSWWRSPPTARKPSETDAKSCGADAALREMALVDLPSGPVETWSEWLRKGSKVTPSMVIDVLDGSEAPPAPAAPSCRRHTGAPQARLDPPPRTPFAPQARLDPPPRTPLRRRLVSILHAGGERARRGLLPSARTAGCVVAFVIAELRAPSRSSTAGGATPHASQSCSREPPPPPLACPPRAAPLSASRPRPRQSHIHL